MAPWGGNFYLKNIFLLNIRRRSARVLKLQQKKEISTPNKNWRPPLAPGGVFRLIKVFFDNFKRCPRVPKLWI
jgi:hypothetical protein